MSDDQEHVSVGAEIRCHPAVAEEIRQALRDAVGEILDGYTEDDVSDYGVD